MDKADQPIPPASLPFLKSLLWQTDPEAIADFTLREMLNVYERGWKYLDVTGSPSEEELNFIRELATHYNSWLIQDI